MGSRMRLLLAVVLGVLLVMVTTAAFATVAVLHEGTIALAVEEAGGRRVSLDVPVSVARVALRVVPALVGDELAGELDELRAHWPLVRAACRELERCPDGVLVEVSDPSGDRVRIAKAGGDLVLVAADGGDVVRLRIPASAVREVARAAERIAGLD